MEVPIVGDEALLTLVDVDRADEPGVEGRQGPGVLTSVWSMSDEHDVACDETAVADDFSVCSG